MEKAMWIGVLVVSIFVLGKLSGVKCAIGCVIVWFGVAFGIKRLGWPDDVGIWISSIIIGIVAACFREKRYLKRRRQLDSTMMAENANETTECDLTERVGDGVDDGGGNDEEDEASALVNVGYTHEQNGEYRQAARCYRKAAKHGNAIGQYDLALAYENGRGLKCDIEKAKMWYRKAAEQGDEDAKKALARIRRAERKAEKTTGNVLKSTDAIEKLNAMIGLGSVKEDVRRLVAFVTIQQQRARKGLKTTPISYHCVFTGNPGTGKTTVARIVAEIYKDLGVIKEGRFKEAQRSDLVAEYLGQTEAKTNKVIDEAIDGVLFIDEAYSLVGDDYGQQAITALLKRMEDDRDRLVVILAGYRDEMRKFIDSNPGLQSRFNRYIHFEDYSATDLQQIFEQMLSQNQYQCDDELRKELPSVFNRLEASKDKNFGNGRVVRNLFEKTLSRQSERLAKLKDPSEEELQTIVLSDLNG